MGFFAKLFNRNNRNNNNNTSDSSKKKKKNTSGAASTSSAPNHHHADLFQSFSPLFIHTNILKFLPFNDVLLNVSLINKQFRNCVIQFQTVGIRIHDDEDEEHEHDIDSKKKKKKKKHSPTIITTVINELPFERVVKVQVFGRPVHIPTIHWKCVKKLYFDVHYYHDYHMVSDIINSALLQQQQQPLESNAGEKKSSASSLPSQLTDICIHNTKFPNNKLTISHIIQGVNSSAGFSIRKLETCLETEFFDLLKSNVEIKYLSVKENFTFEGDLLEGNEGLCKIERFKCTITHSNLHHFKKLIVFPDFQPEVLELCISNQIAHSLPEIIKLCNSSRSGRSGNGDGVIVPLKRIILSGLDGCFIWHSLSRAFQEEDEFPKCEIDVLSFCTLRVDDSLLKFKQHNRVQSMAIAIHEQEEVEKLLSLFSTSYNQLIHLMISCENPHIYNSLVSTISASFHLIHAHQIVMFKRYHSQSVVSPKKVYEVSHRLRKFTMLNKQEKATIRRSSADNQEIKIVEDVFPSPQWKHYKKPTIKILSNN